MEAVVPSARPNPLDVQNLSTGYGKKVVLNGITFGVQSAEVFGLVGLNGAGKTTLVRSILDLHSSTGEIAIFGESSALPQSRRNLVYLPEKFQPSPQLKGFEYLSILLGYFKQDLDHEAAEDIANQLDLDTAALRRSVRTYSKGMGQKLGLVGSFLVKAPLMILDEPMSGLDPRARVLLKDKLISARSEGRSIFFSSHILADMEEICTRIGVLHGGRLIFLGTPEAFIEQYAAPSLERAFLVSLEESGQAALAV